MTSPTVSAAVSAFLDFARETTSPATHQLYRHYLGRFAARFGGRFLADLSPAEVRAWGVRFHPLQAAKRLTRWAFAEAGLIALDPLAHLRRPRVGRRLRTLRPAECARVVRRARGSFRFLVLALRESIARPADLRAVNWANIRLPGLEQFDVESLERGEAFFVLDTFKAQDRRRDGVGLRVIPIGPRLGRMLGRLWRAGPELGSRVFINSKGRPWTSNAVRCGFRRLRVRAALVADWRGENVVAYTLRHTAATAAIVAGVEVGALAGAMGHSDIRTTMRYVHLAPQFLAQVVAKMRTARRRRRGAD